MDFAGIAFYARLLGGGGVEMKALTGQGQATASVACLLIGWV